ncbi:unnamed protein product [Adineta steineri]|uniref:Uncharacterized protein n=1 Tax=Adineta steineri TaxID=433720 RepID=A0A814SVX3_9BILA|nr:unnamed protein product [Adineta steineri]CAF3591851.1 unnamed protein product [Adineta steineri]
MRRNCGIIQGVGMGIGIIFISYSQQHPDPDPYPQSFSKTLLNINLQNNQFLSLTNNYFLRHLEQLRTLDLSKNYNIEIYTQDFLGLNYLDILILRDNKITYLSYAAFAYCQKITTLDLSDNKKLKNSFIK